MFKYTIKRLLQSVVTVLIVVTIVFLLMRMLPTDYFFTEDQLMKFTSEQKEEQLQAAGLLDPMPKQLVRYYGQLLKFDFGESRRIQNGVDVVSVIGDKFTISMKLGCTALVISLFVGILIGIIQTLNKDRILDHVGTAYTIFVNAVPSLVSTHLCWHLVRKCSGFRRFIRHGIRQRQVYFRSYVCHWHLSQVMHSGRDVIW